MSDKWMIENREGGGTFGPFTGRLEAEEAAKDWNDSGVGQWSVRRLNRKEKLVEGGTWLVAGIVAVVLFGLMLWIWWPSACFVVGC